MLVREGRVSCVKSFSFRVNVLPTVVRRGRLRARLSVLLMRKAMKR